MVSNDADKSASSALSSTHVMSALFTMNKLLKVYIIAIKRLYKADFMVNLQNGFAL